jgi:hypothetical protein
MISRDAGVGGPKVSLQRKFLLGHETFDAPVMMEKARERVFLLPASLKGRNSKYACDLFADAVIGFAVYDSVRPEGLSLLAWGTCQ